MRLVFIVATLLFALAHASTVKLESKVHAELCALAQGRPANESTNIIPSCQVAVLAGGSFLILSRAFESKNGVIKVIKGYTGGFVEDPTFENVTRGTTGHAESVLVVYNANLTSYATVLDTFWRSHQATELELNRVVGLDNKTHTGTQFRSTIFTIDKKQHIVATRQKAKMLRVKNITLTTTIEEFNGVFWMETSKTTALLRRRAQLEAEGIANVTTAAVAESIEATLAAKPPAATQGAGRDDAVAVEASKLDAKGELFGAARMRWLRKLKEQKLQRAKKANSTNAAEPATTTKAAAKAKKVAAATDGAVDDVDVVEPPPPTTTSAAATAEAVKAAEPKPTEEKESAAKGEAPKEEAKKAAAVAKEDVATKEDNAGA